MVEWPGDDPPDRINFRNRKTGILFCVLFPGPDRHVFPAPFEDDKIYDLQAQCVWLDGVDRDSGQLIIRRLAD